MASHHSTIPDAFFTNPEYVGKHVVVLDGVVYTATTGDELAMIVEELRRKYPDKQPTIGYVPKEDSLILIVWR